MLAYWSNRTTRFLLTAGLCGLFANTAFAQSNTLFGSRGPLSAPSGMIQGTGGSGTGSYSSGGSSFGSAFGSSTGSGFGSGASGFGSSTSGFGSSQSGVGTGQTRTGFVGRSDTTGRFVGSTQAGSQQTGTFGRGQFSQFGRGMTNQGFGNLGMQGANALNAQGQENAPAGAARLLHAQQKVAFEHKEPQAEAASKVLAQRLKRLSQRRELKGAAGVKFEVTGNSVTIRGVVDSEDTKRLVGMLAGLEPGINKVHNELAIAKGVLPRSSGPQLTPPTK